MEEIVALLDQPLDDFVAVRNARAKELKAEGRKDEGAALAKVKKPSKATWLLGQVQRANPEDASHAAAVAGELETAQSGGGGDLRTLLRELKDAVDVLAHAGTELEGAPAAAEIALSLRPVLAEPDAREAWLEGRLLALPGEAGASFGDGGGGTGTTAARRKEQGEPEDEGPDPRALQAAERAVADAEKAVVKAEARRDDRAERVAELEARLASLREELDEATTRLEDAGRAVDEAEAAAADARAALDDLRG